MPRTGTVQLHFKGRADYLVIWIGEKEQHATNTSETIEDGSHMSWIQFIIYDINV